ncbi:UNVERIFIED_ORG: hypothetical protein E4P37_10150 [Bacillus sp. AZ43]
MPQPIALDMPPGDPAEVEDLVRDVAGAAFRLAGIGEVLAGRAGGTPGWLGDDATAAEAQLDRVTGIVREAGAAVLAATGRLSAHGELLRETRRQVRALREEQAEDFRLAQRQLLETADPQYAVMTGALSWAGTVAEVEAAEARRRRRHELLLEELADDVAATTRALAQASRPVGGAGRPGDGRRVLAHLAAALPGWGDPELAHRGLAAGRELATTSMTPEERMALAREVAAYAHLPAFASAFVRGLDVEGVGGLLHVVGEHPAGPLAGVLAAALGGAVPGTARTDRVRAVLEADHLPADDTWSADRRAAGMAAVLLAGAGSAAPRTATVAEWARQLLVHEQATGRPPGLPAGTPGRGPGEPHDAVEVAVAALAREATPTEAAVFLGGRRTWEMLLARHWADGGELLGALVGTAADDAGPDGDRAVRLGLQTIGAGLFAGDPSGWTVDRGTVAAVAPALGHAVAAHVAAAADALGTAASGADDDGTGQQVRGLGLVLLDGEARAAVQGALVDWSVTQVRDGGRSSPESPHPAIAVTSAFVAVREHGYRLDHALDGHELRERAEDREQFWKWTAGLVLELASHARATPLAVVAEVAGTYAPMLLDMDGTFDLGPDRAPRLDADDAAALARGVVPADLAARVHVVEAQARAAFERTARLLGGADAPVSPPKDYRGATFDLATDWLSDLAIGEARARGGVRGGGSSPDR